MKVESTKRIQFDYVSRNSFVNNETKAYLTAGAHVSPPKQLCDTYQRLADHGGDEFYSGALAADVVADLNDSGSVITLKDLEDYK